MKNKKQKNDAQQIVMRVCLIGGTGRFGQELARRMPGVDMVLASRGGTLRLDRLRDSEAELEKKLRGFSHVVDVAGPFQEVDFRVARASIRAGAHYVDLADSAEWLERFPRELDALAREHGVWALSGASTTPAITAAAVRELGLARLDRVESVIHATGGAAGLSVIRAVLSYCGRPVATFRGGRQQTAIGWRGLRWSERRLASDVATVDPILFPSMLGVRAESTFGAALDSYVMQLGMYALSFVGRFVSVEPVAPALHKLQLLLQPFRGHRGALVMRIAGVDASGQNIDSKFALRATGGQGFGIPIVPVIALLNGPQNYPAGARVCAGDEASYDRVRQVVSDPKFFTTVTMGFDTRVCKNVFARFLPEMDEACRFFHSSQSEAVRKGKIDIEAGRSLLARVAQWINGFPTVSEKGHDLVVTVDRKHSSEVWTREIVGISRFSSEMSAEPDGTTTERFGPFKFRLGTKMVNKQLMMPVEKIWFFGIPVPSFLIGSDSREFQNADGKYAFDVRVTSLGMLIVHYKGYLD